MSYDYNGSVQAFAEARRAAAAAADRDSKLRHLQRAVTTAETLSRHCPLTPLLWIHYAATLSDYCQLCGGTAASTPTTTATTNNNEAEAEASAILGMAQQLELQTLQLGLTEFPGSALLQLRTVIVQLLLLKTTTTTDATSTSNSVQQTIAAICAAIDAVGQGSHRNEAEPFIVALYRLWAAAAAAAMCSGITNNATQEDHPPLWVMQQLEQTVAPIFIQRSRVPMKDANQNIMDEWHRLLMGTTMSPSTKANTAITTTVAAAVAAATAAMEQGRRFEAKVYSQFATYEDALDVALHRDGVLARIHPEFQQYPSAVVVDNNSNTATATAAIMESTIFGSCWDHIDWDAVVRSSDQKYGMGLGSVETAKLFVQYARALKQFKLARASSDDDDDETSRATTIETVQSLAMAVYERGVAECPCIDYLWLSYIRDLQQWIQQGHSHNNNGGVLAAQAAARLQHVTARAVRNCPYSVPLLQQKLLAVLFLATLSSASTVISHQAVVDPDQLLGFVQEGLDLGFLPKSPAIALDLYLLAIRIVKRRILYLLACRCSSPTSKPNNTKNKPSKPVYYDDGEPLPNNNQNGKPNNNTRQADNSDDDAMQEVQDLLEDIGDMYDDVESRLRKAAASWTEGRALLWKERAQTEALLLTPLRQVLGATAGVASQEHGKKKTNATCLDQLQSFEKCIRAHNPPHPDSYALYIRQYVAAITTVPAECAEEVLFRIRRVRFLFEKALSAVGKSKVQDELADAATAAQLSSLALRDFETALFSLCNEWLDFERIFGSERSLGKASKAVEKKLHKAVRQTRVSSQSSHHPKAEQQLLEETATSSTESTAKRKHGADEVSEAVVDNNDGANRPVKKAKTDSRVEKVDGSEPSPMETEPTEGEEKAEASAPKSPDSKSLPKVHVGNMDYPAHPFTVRVSNLSMDTEDMDLVDTFRAKCGAIVHAKIIRDKSHHGKGKSKGWGLIQFEHCESVEKALALDDTLGIHEKLVKVDRSHMPAASVVPPGMHRVHPKGEGKVSKRNQKRRERKMSEDTGDRANEPSPNDEAYANSKTQGSDVTSPREPPAKPEKPHNFTSALAFRPRGVGRGGHQKPRIKLDGSSKTTDK